MEHVQVRRPAAPPSHQPLYMWAREGLATPHPQAPGTRGWVFTSYHRCHLRDPHPVRLHIATHGPEAVAPAPPRGLFLIRGTLLMFPGLREAHGPL